MSHKNRADREPKSLFSAITSGIGTAAGLSIAVAGGWILYSNLMIDHDLPLPYAMNTERVEFESKTAGKLSYYVDRQKSGRPLVLLHSINAAASAYEMKPLFEHFRSSRPVYALDLPGFGFSGRPSRSYDPLLYEEAIGEWMVDQVGEPADVIALSLGCEFAAAVSLKHPDLFHSLTLISPTGFGASAAGKRGKDGLYAFFTHPVWRRPLFDLIVTRASLRFFLQKSFVGPLPPGISNYAFNTSHQPGAEYAPLAFISGRLFTPAVRDSVYARVAAPTLVLYDRDGYTSFENLPIFLETNPAWRAVKLSPTFGLPHFEKLRETVQELVVFWKEISSRNEDEI